MLEMMNRMGQKIANMTGLATPCDEAFLKSRITKDVTNFFQEELPYRHFDEETGLYIQENSMGFVIEVSPMMGIEAHKEKEIGSLCAEIGSEGDSMQFLLWGDHRIDPKLDDWSKARASVGGLYSKIAAKKKAFFQQGIRSSDCPPPRDFRLFVSYSSPTATKKQLAQKMEKTLNFFKRTSHAKAMKPQEFIDTFSGIVNYDGQTELRARERNPFNFLANSLCLHGSIRQCDTHVEFSHPPHKRYFQAFEVIEYPEEWSINENQHFLGDVFDQDKQIHTDFFIHYGLFFPNQTAKETRLRTKQKTLQNQLKFKAMHKLFSTSQQEHDEICYALEEMKNGHKLVQTHFNIGLFTDPEERENQGGALQSKFKSLGFKIEPVNSLHLDELIKSLPMTWGESKRQREMSMFRSFKTTTTHEVGALVPLLAEWKGNSKTGMPFVGRRGQFLTWDMFATDGNYNTVVVGDSGTGKSVFMAELLETHLGYGARAFVLDKGGSFKNLCKVQKGQYLKFSEKDNLNLNPFNMVPETVQKEVVENALNMVNTIICTMAVPGEKIDEDRKNMIVQAVKKVFFEKGRKAVVDDVISVLQEERYETERMRGNAESLILSLQKYAIDGQYRSYFYGVNDFSLKADFTVIETEELQNSPDLQAVVLQIFSLMIANEIFLGDRSRRSVVCIDEASQLLVSPQMGDFIGGMARRLRKHNSALLVGTQSVADFQTAPGAKAAFKNSNWFVMLGCNDEELETIKKDCILNLNPFTEAALKSLKMEGGKYSEAFIRNSNSRFSAVVQLKLDPFSLGLFSTKPETLTAIKALEVEGFSTEDAIEKLIETGGVS